MLEVNKNLSAAGFLFSNCKIHLISNQKESRSWLEIRRQMPRIGTRKLHYLLKDTFQKERIAMGRDRLFDLLRGEGLLINRKRKYIRTTNSRHWMRKYPNLVGQLQITQPEQVWAADITYIAVGSSYGVSSFNHRCSL